MSASHKKLLEIEDISLSLDEKEKNILHEDNIIINEPIKKKEENKIYQSSGNSFQYDSIVKKDRLLASGFG